MLKVSALCTYLTLDSRVLTCWQRLSADPGGPHFRSRCSPLRVKYSSNWGFLRAVLLHVKDVLQRP